MTEVTASAKSPARQKRVKRLKKIIVGFFLTVMIIPTVIAVVFGILYASAKRDLNVARDELNWYLEQQSEYDFVSGNSEGEGLNEVINNDEPKTDNIRSEQATLTEGELKNLKLSDDELYEGYRKVYLTFDDGPSANTDDILDILAEYDVKATFFTIMKEGNNFENLYRRIVNEGHTIGMHSCTHEYSVVYKDRESFMEDTKKLRNFIYMVTGVESNFYRFPGGSSNRVSRVDVKTLARDLHEEGIEYFDWNVSSQDSAGGIHTSDEIFANATSRIKNYDEVIILFHDTNSKVSTVEALPEIIKYIQSLDNTVILPITDGTRPIQHLTVH